MAEKIKFYMDDIVPVSQSQWIQPCSSWTIVQRPARGLWSAWSLEFGSTESTEDQLEALSEAGLIAWNSQKLQPLAPIAQAKGDRTVADLLLEDRG